eukprot:14868255-Alexandrium_andersonii.AAC.1
MAKLPSPAQQPSSRALAAKRGEPSRQADQRGLLDLPRMAGRSMGEPMPCRVGALRVADNVGIRAAVRP